MMFQIQSVLSAFLVSLLFNSFFDTSVAYYFPSFSCNGLNISYPFWSLDNYNSSYPQYGGYPGLGIHCSQSTNATLYLSNNTFFVKSINYTNHSLTVMDRDITDNLACPRARHNLSLDHLPLEYSKLDMHYTFYYNCTSPLPSSIPVDCLTSGEKKSYYYIGHNKPKDLNWYGICEDKVVTTELDEGSTRGLATALDQGFILDYSEPNCVKCEATNGLCLYNNSTNKFWCHCKEGSTKFDHCTSKGRIIPVKLSIGTKLIFILNSIIRGRNCNSCYVLLDMLLPI
ncbi:LEAF RUST 10 DISEASE-RESISTANCE LOCUS RECEPTOR-LIKE PROTEIN KINASE-like 2.1 [Lycium barbarum]|uniref:LEAF RUST 10 DISEASE-RESISTANCE LOCUS RECEPTOR-LIKE PROTEIN KINASE-like 2.1 n=1 Tax=Lycium barbarum TaxID=112863 RepID=UPI00293E3370|nr:LEAF RUST 10 DISEASE-RESISTANCE LOCUS RECEPTOR-LIKE PROTEIN KINASE-like 2.1 [Lycium barbarum]